MKGMSSIASELMFADPPVPYLKEADQAPGFIQALDNKLADCKNSGKLMLPNLKHEQFKTIIICSDFGGETQHADFRTYSFLFAGYESTGPACQKFKSLRKKFGLENPFREVCFKNFRYGPVGRCIPDWLHTADALTGLLFTLIVPRETVSLFGANATDTQKELSKLFSELDLGDWKPAVAEKALRIVHIVGYMLGLLSRENQNVIWMCDNDSIFANSERVGQMQKLFAHRLSQYGHGKYGKVSVALPFEKNTTEYGPSELLSIPDLAAGSIESLLTQNNRTTDPRIRLQANSVLLWLANQSVFLKKLAIQIRSAGFGDLEIALTELVPTVATRASCVAFQPSVSKNRKTLNELQRLISLSSKYRRRSQVCKSTPRKRKLMRKSQRYDKRATSLLWLGGRNK